MIDKIDKYLTEEWMPNNLNPKLNREVSKISKMVDYDIAAAAAFAVSLLEDVNFHEAAKVLNDYAVKNI
jgi:hypothetical protein